MKENIIRRTDSYNLSHYLLKKNVDWEVSHLYNRKRGMILFGFEAIATRLLSTIITKEMVDDAAYHAKRNNMPFPYDMFMRVVSELGGRIPLKVQALPDGTWCPKGTPFAQISNTVEGFGELVTWWEEVLMKAYFPSTCATEAYNLRKYIDRKGCSPWRFHNFGARGGRSDTDSDLAGMAWNLFLHGTDDFNSTALTPGADVGSICASAHKVTQQFDPMTPAELYKEFGIWINVDSIPGDVVSFFYGIRAVAQAGFNIFAFPIDTYDAWNVIENYTVHLTDYAKSLGVHNVMRPDSGNVLRQAIRIHEIATENKLDNVSVIIGEGMTADVVEQYDKQLEDAGVPLDFVFYGIGGGFYNHIDRDYLGWAMKTAYSNGANRMKFSEVPLKRSIPGIVAPVYRDGKLVVTYERKDEPRAYKYLYHDGEYSQFVAEPDWNEAQRIALEQTAEQGTIILAQDVHDEIARFAKLYGRG